MITLTGFTVQPYSWVNLAHVFFLYTLLRAYGDKSGPPSLPDAESEGQAVSGEECEVDEDEEEEVQKSVEEEVEEQMPCETITGQACFGIEALSLTKQEEEKGEKGNEEEEGNQDDQKMPQGIGFSHIFHHICENVI